MQAGVPADRLSLSTQELPENIAELVAMGIKVRIIGDCARARALAPRPRPRPALVQRAPVTRAALGRPDGRQVSGRLAMGGGQCTGVASRAATARCTPAMTTTAHPAA